MEIKSIPAIKVFLTFVLLAAQAVGREESSEKQSLTRVPQAPSGRAVMRRLNRVEYQNTIRDLLGIDIDLQELLPQDNSSNGFDNVGEALHTSSFLLEKYLEAADRALGVAIANTPQPPLIKKRYSLKEERLVKTTTESVFLQRDESLVMFSSSAWNSITVGQFYPSDRGRYRIRISAFGHQSGGRPVTFRVDAGPMLMGTKNHLVGYFDAAARHSESEQSTVIEFTDHFEARNHIRISPYGLANAQTVNKIGADKYEGAGLGIDFVEVEGPLHETWPPDCHRRIFGDLKQGPAPAYNASTRVEVVSDNPVSDAVQILSRFARRAFRRPVADADIKPFLSLFAEKQAEGRSFEQSVRVALSAILVSPDFLFLREEPGRLNDHALANRLSYFLWSTMPDDELMNLADRGELSAKFTPQVERMLNDSRSQQFVTNFTGQWLSLRDIDFTEPSHLLHPEFDDLLKVSMVKETELFFAEVLKHDLPLMNFVASDFTMLNGRLAKHYGIPFEAVEGDVKEKGGGSATFRKTMLPPESHRGGVMTMASVLKVTANGTTTSPVLRGAWILDRILGDPPSPPPENVAALEPDIRGATTIREQLARHRQIDSCASCHVDIDPPGFALENFDVIGGWRERYRTTSWGRHVEEARIDGRKMPYYHGLKVDPADKLSDGRAFANVDEFKQLLLADKDKLARALAIKLITYATGAAPSSEDTPNLKALIADCRERRYGFRSLIHLIVKSEFFRTK